MSSIQTAPLLAVALLSISACSGGGSAPSTPPPPNALSIGPDNAVSASRADVSRSGDGRILLRMTEGPMSGMSVECVDATLGRCQVVGGPDGTTAEGTLLARYHGQYAFVGNFSVLQVTDGGLRGSSQLVHAPSPDAATGNVRLPQERANYTGAFHAGGGLANGTSGMVEGTVAMVADFNQAVLSVQMDGQFADGQNVSASYSNITIDTQNGSFTTTDNSVILFQGALVEDGMLSGAFYGPDADEAAGIFELGNEHGGMSGIFLACKGALADCIQP